MTPKRMFPTLALTAACAVGAVPVATARAATDVQTASSGNWSGYVVGASSGAKTFKSVTGSWVQPKASCSTGGTYAAFWVGLGGADGKTALEQDGTEVNCSADGTPSYYAWYELVPHAPVKVDLAVHAGDHMTATTTVDGERVTETIVNHTTGDSFTKTLTMNDPDTSSAEWIAEAPSQCDGSLSNCSTLPLSDFGTVKFTSATATDSSGHTGTISDSAWQTAALTLDPSQSTGGYSDVGLSGGQSSASASPSSLTGSGSAFSVSYRNESAGTSSGDGSGGGYGYGYGGGSGYGGGYGYGSSGDGYGDGGQSGNSGAGSDGYGSGYPGYGYGSGGDGGYIVIYAY